MKRYRDIAGDGGSNIVGQVEAQQARMGARLREDDLQIVSTQPLHVKATVPGQPKVELGDYQSLKIDAAPAEEEEVHSQVASFAITRLTDSPAVVTAVSAEEIRSSGARDLMDVLLLVPGFFFGVDVQGNIGPGFRGLWGVEGKILLLIDGKVPTRLRPVE